MTTTGNVYIYDTFLVGAHHHLGSYLHLKYQKYDE